MLLEMWNEPHRKYHNLNHLNHLKGMIMNDFINNKINNLFTEKLLLTALFHEIIYNPAQKDNKQQSANFFHSLCIEKNNSDILQIKQAILDTSLHIGTILLSEKINYYNMNIAIRQIIAH